MATQIKDYKWIGTRPPRPDGVDKVTGRAKFGADFSLPGMLVGRSEERRVGKECRSRWSPYH